MCTKLSLKENKWQLKLRVIVQRFKVLEGFWDCVIPPKLEQIEEEGIIRALISSNLRQAQQARLLENQIKSN